MSEHYTESNPLPMRLNATEPPVSGDYIDIGVWPGGWRFWTDRDRRRFERLPLGNTCANCGALTERADDGTLMASGREVCAGSLRGHEIDPRAITQAVITRIGEMQGELMTEHEDADTSEDLCIDHGYDVCPDCGNAGTKIGEHGYEPCTRFLSCWTDISTD